MPAKFLFSIKVMSIDTKGNILTYYIWIPNSNYGSFITRIFENNVNRRCWEPHWAPFCKQRLILVSVFGCSDQNNHLEIILIITLFGLGFLLASSYILN